jgi:hypothetical protein
MTNKKNPQIFVIGAVTAPCFAGRYGECAPLRLKAQGLAADYVVRQYFWFYVACTI